MEQANAKRRTAVWILRIFLGVVFLTIGMAKLTSSLKTVQFFAAIGWGQWFRYLTGFLDVLGALLLAHTIGLATVLCLTPLHNNPTIPRILTATLAWLTSPKQAKTATSR